MFNWQELEPYLAKLLPHLKQTLIDPVPEVSSFSEIANVIFVLLIRFVVMLQKLLELWQLVWKMIVLKTCCRGYCQHLSLILALLIVLVQHKVATCCNFSLNNIIITMLNPKYEPNIWCSCWSWFLILLYFRAQRLNQNITG